MSSPASVPTCSVPDCGAPATRGTPARPLCAPHAWIEDERSAGMSKTEVMVPPDQTIPMIQPGWRGGRAVLAVSLGDPRDGGSTVMLIGDGWGTPGHVRKLARLIAEAMKLEAVEVTP